MNKRIIDPDPVESEIWGMMNNAVAVRFINNPNIRSNAAEMFRFRIPPNRFVVNRAPCTRVNNQWSSDQ